MKSYFIKIIAFLVLFFVFAGNANAYYELGKPVGFVNDYSQTLTQTEKQNLESKIAQFKKDSSNEISVVIIKSLGGDTIENFAVKLFEDWGIGEKGKDNGVLIFVAKDDREMRIEVGYGLEGALTDAQSSWIINQIMTPAFKNNNFYGGLDGAVGKILSILEVSGPSNISGTISPFFRGVSIVISSLIFLVLSIIALLIVYEIFIVIFTLLGISRSWWFGGVVGGVVGVLIGFAKGFIYIGLIAIVSLVFLGLVLDYFASKFFKDKNLSGKINWSVVIGNMVKRIGSYRGGGGFGGFGGGRSGGGGSSGKW
jgi:uncharacterized protein